MQLDFVPATIDQLPRLQEIRAAAFAPVFASFRSLLGDAIYDVAQAHEDAGQAALLASLLLPDSGSEVWAVLREQQIVGFVAIQLDHARGIGTIGLNAVHPSHAGAGIGTAMYEYAVRRMKAAGMRVATVGTGGDESHAPARRAYRKAGFNAVIPSVWMCRSLE
jgi:ribosomal protein S18 acetylase RimI-like enzyme